ncbi:MAG: hypothetical protein WBF33_31165 [Candidatus Nitrosopolaris sp.]
MRKQTTFVITAAILLTAIVHALYLDAMPTMWADGIFKVLIKRTQITSIVLQILQF